MALTKKDHQILNANIHSYCSGPAIEIWEGISDQFMEGIREPAPLSEIDKNIRIEILKNNSKIVLNKLKTIEEILKYFKAWKYTTKPVYLTSLDADKYESIVREFLNYNAAELMKMSDELIVLGAEQYIIKIELPKNP